MVALLIPAFVGLAGLGAETGLWYAIKRQNQSAADEAAISGAMEVAANVADITAQATTTATRNGFNNNAPNTITVNNPPSSGPNSNNQDAVEVILSQQQGGLFASLYMPNVTIKTRAVALANSTGACVVALAPSGQDAVNVTGNATVDASTCNIYDNSNNSKALEVQGGSATLKVDNAYIVGTNPGDCAGPCNGNSTLTGTVKTGATMPNPLDPYCGNDVAPACANRTPPTVGACGANPTIPGGGGAPAGFNWGQQIYPLKIYPGVYCTDINPNGPLTMSPGMYIMKGVNFDPGGGGGTLSGGVCTGPINQHYVNAPGGVTVYLTGNGKISVSTCLSITAPTAAQVANFPAGSGNTAGIAFWQAASDSQQDSFNGGSSVYIEGAIYAPSAQVTYTGSTIGASSCTQIVAYQAVFNGSATLNSNCNGTGVLNPADPGAAVSLAE
jgi:hypothetical protein